MNTPNSNRLPTFKRKLESSTSTSKKASQETISKWKKANLNSIGIDERDQITKKIALIIERKAKLGRDIIVGFNSVMRSVEQKGVSVICVAQDGHQAMLKCLVESAQANAIPVMALPKLSQSLRNIVSLKSASCFALPKMKFIPPQSQSSSADNQNFNDGEDDEVTKARHEDESRVALIDDLRDYLLSL